MSLNHISSSTPENKWMNIGANDIKCVTLETSGTSTFNGPFNVVETVPSTITGSNSVEMLSLQNSNVGTNTLTTLRIINPGGNSSLRLSEQNNTNIGLINADNALNISTTGSSAISLQPNASTTATFAPTSTNITTVLTVPNQTYIEYNLTVAQSIPNSTLTSVLFPTLVKTVGDISYNSGTGVFSFATNGVYNVSFYCLFASGSDTGVRLGQITTSLSNVLYGLDTTPSISGTSMAVTGSSSIYIASTTTLVISVQQISGGSLNLNNARVVINRVS